MTLVLHHDPLLGEVQVVPHLCPAQGPVEEVTVGLVEWQEVWDSWAAPEDLEVDSLEEDLLLVPRHQTLGLTPILALAACQASEVVEAEEVEEEVFHLVGHHSLTCHPISALLCTLGRASTQCCHLEQWEVDQEVEEVRLILGLGCLSNSLNMDREVIPLTAHPYLEALDLVGPLMAP